MNRAMTITVAALVALIGVAVAGYDATPKTAAARLHWSGRDWNVFDGTGNLGQHWSRSHVVVGKSGRLNEYVSGGVAGGVGSRAYSGFGVYQVRFRMSRGGGKYAILLFGHGAHQEVDFGEGKLLGDPDRTQMTGTLHYGAANNQTHIHVLGDFTRWHTTSVEWQPGSLTFRLDGNVWAVITSHVPQTEMHLTLQTNASPDPAPALFQASGVSYKPEGHQ